MSDLTQLPRRLMTRLRGNDVAFPGQNLIDRLRGLDFLEAVPAEAHGLDPDVVHRSAPSGGRHLLRLLRTCDIQATDTLLDIGSGKGHLLRTIRHLPFARLDGLELAPELVAIAQRNFIRLHMDRTTIFTGDARTFEHYANYTYLYLCNPFPDKIMEPVVARIEASLVERQRALTVVYANVICESFLRSKSFELLQRSRNRLGLPVDVYRSV